MKKTALYDRHIQWGARMVDFGGWAMPVQYTNVIDEHQTTRGQAGLFDICHMGEIAVRGPDAFDLLQLALSRNLQDQHVGQMKLGLLLNDSGGIIDDVTLYFLDQEDYLLVTNAATKDRDYEWLKKIREERRFNHVSIIDLSDQTGKIDLQGPAAERILQQLVPDKLSELKFYHCMSTKFAGIPVMISRSGYTGEDGFEIYSSSIEIVTIWDELLNSGSKKGLKPAGLGSRDTLRLEAGMMLNGSDMDERTTPYEVVYGWITDMDKEFIGKEALAALKARGFSRKLIGFEMEDRGIARGGYSVLRNDRVIGRVTSGTFSPTLGKPIGLAFVPLSCKEPGTTIDIQIRNRLVKARVTPLPFYRKQK